LLIAVLEVARLGSTHAPALPAQTHWSAINKELLMSANQLQETGDGRRSILEQNLNDFASSMVI
jgi:hypothetical protein